MMPPWDAMPLEIWMTPASPTLAVRAEIRGPGAVSSRDEETLGRVSSCATATLMLELRVVVCQGGCMQPAVIRSAY